MRRFHLESNLPCIHVVVFVLEKYKKYCTKNQIFFKKLYIVY